MQLLAQKSLLSLQNNKTISETKKEKAIADNNAIALKNAYKVNNNLQYQVFTTTSAVKVMV